MLFTECRASHAMDLRAREWRRLAGSDYIAGKKNLSTPMVILLQP